MTFHLQTMPLQGKLLRLTPPPLKLTRWKRESCLPDTGATPLPWSECRRYLACPLQAALSATRRADFVSAGWVFSSALRATVAAYYRARRPEAAWTVGTLVEVFKRAWAKELAGGASGQMTLPVRYTDTDEGEAGQFALAERVLATFLSEQGRSEVVAAETHFKVSLAPDLPPVEGRIDRMEIRRGADGLRRLHLVAFKVAARKPSRFELDTDRLALYAEAARKLELETAFRLPLAFNFEVLTKTRKSELIDVPFELEAHAVDRLTELVRMIHRGMSAGIRYPVKSWRCGGCGCASACAAWPNCPAGVLSVPTEAAAA